MRAVLVAERLQEDPPEATVGAIADLIAGAVRRGHGDAVMALGSLTSALSDGDLVSYQVRRTLYTEAMRLGRQEVARLFLDVSPRMALPDRVRDPLAPERSVEPRGRPLTLGERKALARCHRRELLQHLLRDPHPAVVEVLLGNPHLTEPWPRRACLRCPRTAGGCCGRRAFSA
jgi:hypothetical protein